MTSVHINRGQMTALAEAIRAAIQRDIVKEVADDARRYVPVDTGALRDSIQYDQVSDDSWEVSAGGGDVDYAVPVELGHRVVHRTASGMLEDTGHVVPPQPYLRPALYKRRSFR